MFEKRVVIDCRDHLLGRLASVVAKELLNGQRVVCVRTEGIVVTGSFVRNKLKYLQFKNKRCNYQPKNGPFHHRAPSKIFWRVVRGMVPHKTARGTAAMARLKVFEGVPPPYDVCKRVVVPDALRTINLRPTRTYTVLGRLSSEVGWKYGDVVETLERKRKIRASTWYARKKAVENVRRKAAQSKTVAEVDEQLRALGAIH